MVVSDLDKRLLYELSRDARQTYKQLAQRINSKKEVIAYHITQLLKEGVITKFVPVISLTRLGVYTFKLYLRLHGLTNTAEQELYTLLIESDDIAWVASCVGQWDILIAMYAPDIVTFAQKKNKLLQDFSEYIESYDVTMIEDALVFNRDYLIKRKPDYRKEFVFGGAQERTELKIEEWQLLHEIRNNGRYEAIGVGRKLKRDSRTVISDVKRLQKQGIIQGTTTFVKLSKFGMQLHKLCVHLGSHKKMDVNRLIAFIKTNQNVIHLIQSLGSWELEIELEETNTANINTYVRELKNNFPATIKRIDVVTITEEHKIEFFPANPKN